MQLYAFNKSGQMIAGLAVDSVEEMRQISRSFNRFLKRRYRDYKSRWNFATTIGDANTVEKCGKTFDVESQPENILEIVPTEPAEELDDRPDKMAMEHEGLFSKE